jgi:hypothetical protein
MRYHMATRGNGTVGYSPISAKVPCTCYHCNTTSKINLLDRQAECPFCGNPVIRFKNGHINPRRSAGGGKKQGVQFDEYGKEEAK